MKRLFCCAALPLLACVCWAARTPVPQTSGDQIQRFVVVHSIHFVARTETVTNAEANCSIETAEGAASMECHPGGVTAKNTYHYNAALIVDGKGMGYVIACRNSLVAFWCKEFGSRTVIRGNLSAAKLALADGDKTHDYVVLASKFVGLTAVTPVSQAPAAPRNDVAPIQPPATPTSPVNRAKDNSASLPANSSAACSSSAGACVSFFSDPSGADIYVDGKFAGNAPSMLVLSPGSHEVRLEETDRKPWTRTLETSSGSNVTLRATFDAASDK
jgi:PEGA domain